MARFELVGYHITGDRRLGCSPGAGIEKAHVAVDDATRLAYVEVLPDVPRQSGCPVDTVVLTSPNRSEGCWDRDRGQPVATRQSSWYPHCIFKAATRPRLLHHEQQPPIVSVRGDIHGVRLGRAGSLKVGDRIALAINAAEARYRSLSRTGKQRLLDELQALTGYHRKSPLRRLNQQPDQRQTSLRGQHRRRYGPEEVEALLPQLVESLEHHGHLQLEPSVRARVLTMSSATIDRLLAPVRQKQRGQWMAAPSAGP